MVRREGRQKYLEALSGDVRCASSGGLTGRQDRHVVIPSGREHCSPGNLAAFGWHSCYARSVTTTRDLRRSAPAALRNRDPILAVLRTVLPSSGMVLEVASGTGEHVVHFARHVPNLEWQPSDPSAAARASIAAWVATEGLTNVGAPLEIDVAQHPWPIHQAAAIVCINMVHISPWDATVGLMRGASQLLPNGGALYLYGPFRRSGRPLEPTNEIFDRDLRSRDLRWGLRDLDAVIQSAADHHLAFERVVEMPADNLSVILRRACS